MQESLATELLHELKSSSRRWFIAFIVSILLWFATIAVFVWYISLPVEELVTVDNDDGIAAYIGNDFNGEIVNGESNS